MRGWGLIAQLQTTGEIEALLSGESCRCSRLLNPLDNDILLRVIDLKPEVPAVGFRLLYIR